MTHANAAAAAAADAATVTPIATVTAGLAPVPAITREQFAAKFLPPAEATIANAKKLEERSVNVKLIAMRDVTGVHLLSRQVTDEQLPQTGRWACELLRERGYDVEIDFCGGFEGRAMNVGIFVRIKPEYITDAKTPEEFRRIWLPKAIEAIDYAKLYRQRLANTFFLPLNTIKTKWYQRIVRCNFTEDQLPEQGKWACAAMRAMGHKVEIFWSPYKFKLGIFTVINYNGE